MLSVLIPVKDWNPLVLIESIVSQLIECEIPGEILISDDSTFSESSKISDLASEIPMVRYFCRKHPLGRSGNRNFLADQAKFQYLLFIDGDAGVQSNDFIRKYLESADKDTVLCGGTLYKNEPPADPDFLLRWKYGKAREQSDAKNRQKKPWKSFTTFNFLVPVDLFQKIRFDESISGYGHEDTIFGIQLHLAGIHIKHLDNGLLHLGLEPSLIYLEKVRQSGVNLRNLYSRGLFPPGNVKDVALLAAWIRFKKLHLSWLFGAWFRYRKNSIEKKLCGGDPSLLLLDLYKLGSISHIG
jgi:glycosyltransferase involved in cell wall biosynthesis